MVISGLWVLAGIKQRPQLVIKGQRSPTSYVLARKVNHAINSITSFSEAPLRLIFGVGMKIFGEAGARVLEETRFCCGGNYTRSRGLNRFHGQFGWQVNWPSVFVRAVPV